MLGTQHCLIWLGKKQDRRQSSGLSSSPKTGWSSGFVFHSDGLPKPLQPDVFPGNCWAFEGDQGQVVIRLPGHVQLSDITLQHPPPTVAHTGGASSAPRDFAVYVSGAEAWRWGSSN